MHPGENKKRPAETNQRGAGGETVKTQTEEAAMSRHVNTNHSQRARRVNSQPHSRQDPYCAERETLTLLCDMATEAVQFAHPSWRYEPHPNANDHTVVHVVLMSTSRGRLVSEDVAVVHLPDYTVHVTEEQAHYHAPLVDTLEYANFNIQIVQ